MRYGQVADPTANDSLWRTLCGIHSLRPVLNGAWEARWNPEFIMFGCVTRSDDISGEVRRKLLRWSWRSSERPVRLSSGAPIEGGRVSA